MKYIHITKENIDREHICCAMSGKQALAKKEWLKQRFDEGLVFYRSEERGKCFIEYIPAENAWVPIEAGGWLYINCLWVSGSMKGHGYSSELLSECIRDAKEQGKKGICILCAEGRKREFLADPKFLKYKGFKSQIYLTVGSTSCTCPLQRMRISRDSKIVPDIRKSAKRALSSIIPTSVFHLLLGAEGTGSGKGTRHIVSSISYYRQRSRAECTCAGHHLCPVPGWRVFDSGHSVR